LNHPGNAHWKTSAIAITKIWTLAARQTKRTQLITAPQQPEHDRTPAVAKILKKEAS